MSMLQKKGTYLASLGNTSVEEKDTGTVFFNALCKCTHIRNGNNWDAIDGDQAIISRLNLVKKDGSLNEININNVKASTGWDGASFAGLQKESGWGDLQVQIVVDEEQYEGKTSLRVEYMNPKDYAGSGGGIKAMDQQVIQSLDSKYGSMLRAMAGAKLGNGNGNSKAAASVSASGDSMGKQLAWSILNTRCDEYSREHPEDAYSNDRKVQTFKTIVASTVPGKSGAQITPSDWAQIKHAIDKDFSPAIGDLIPI